MKHEVFILGQTIDQKARRDGREARGNEEKRRERIEKGSREGKETKRQFEEKEGPRDPPFIRIRPCDVAIVSSSPQGGAQASKYVQQAYRMHY